jgi:hypothetical protein
MNCCQPFRHDSCAARDEFARFHIPGCDEWIVFARTGRNVLPMLDAHLTDKPLNFEVGPDHRWFDRYPGDSSAGSSPCLAVFSFHARPYMIQWRFLFRLFLNSRTFDILELTGRFPEIVLFTPTPSEVKSISKQ